MPENTFKYLIINYWRSIDKKILLCFFILFFLGLFFSFSSTSSLAGERMNKDLYFFFTKHLIFTFLALIIMILISVIKTELLLKLVIPLFVVSFVFLAPRAKNRQNRPAIMPPKSCAEFGLIRALQD